MSIILDGTNGITTPDVDSTTSVTTPLVTSSGALALSTTSANVITASTNGAERMRITSTGDVGIGTNDPIRTLSVHGDAELFGSSRTVLQVADTAAQAAGRGGGIAFTGNLTDGVLNGNTWFATIQGFKENSTSGNTAAAMAFSTRPSGGNPTERMRIDASGAVLVGMTSDNPANVGSRLFPNGAVTGTRDGDPAGIFNRLSSNGDVVLFRRQTQPVGSISVTTTSTSYNTSSDYRLKENVAPLSGAADRLAQIPVHRFNFIADPDTTVDGFLAHEVQPYVPEAITGTKDEVDDEGNPVHQGIDQSKLVPLLTAALQEALQKIEALETRISALETPA